MVKRLTETAMGLDRKMAELVDAIVRDDDRLEDKLTEALDQSRPLPEMTIPLLLKCCYMDSWPRLW